MLSVSHLRGKFARLVALLALIAGLIGAALPSAATPAEPVRMHAAMDCDQGSHHPAPKHQLPGGGECCIVSVCAMGLALPAVPSGIALPGSLEALGYDRLVLLQPLGIVTTPIPHPPKSFA